jgi:hypothetical protein
MLCRVALVRTDVLEEQIASMIRVTRMDSCHPVNGGATFLRSVSSYKSQTTQHLRRRHSLCFLVFTSAIPEDIPKQSNSECCRQSSEPLSDCLELEAALIAGTRCELL